MGEELGVRYVEGYRPGALGRIAEMHGAYYANVWGSGFEFEAMVANEMAPFLAEYDVARDLLLTAWVGNRIVGSCAIVGEPGMARLRWFIVEESSHGKGIGRELLTRSLDFCRHAGHECVYLWTVEGLPQSMAMYERAGFRVVEKTTDARHSLEHVNVRMEVDLASSN